MSQHKTRLPDFINPSKAPGMIESAFFRVGGSLGNKCVSGQQQVRPKSSATPPRRPVVRTAQISKLS